jgi:heme-degrading monooxygenase HmoA
MIMQIVRFKSQLPREEVLAVARERAAMFREIPGLLQKYYLDSEEPDSYAGVYIWDSVESMMRFRSSDLAASIPAAYRVTKPPEIEIHEVVFTLR